jgi:hypothetical protein
VRPGDRAPTSYFQLQREREQRLELDAATDGHDAMRLQSERLRKVPRYPQQPSSSPWSGNWGPNEPPTGENINFVADVSKVER